MARQLTAVAVLETLLQVVESVLTLAAGGAAPERGFAAPHPLRPRGTLPLRARPLWVRSYHELPSELCAR